MRRRWGSGKGKRSSDEKRIESKNKFYLGLIIFGVVLIILVAVGFVLFNRQILFLSPVGTQIGSCMNGRV